MLVLSRKVGQKILIGKNITLTLVRIQGERVRIGIEAPEDVLILRPEVSDRREECVSTVPSS